MISIGKHKTQTLLLKFNNFLHNIPTHIYTVFCFLVVLFVCFVVVVIVVCFFKKYCQGGTIFSKQ